MCEGGGGRGGGGRGKMASGRKRGKFSRGKSRPTESFSSCANRFRHALLPAFEGNDNDAFRTRDANEIIVR